MDEIKTSRTLHYLSRLETACICNVRQSRHRYVVGVEEKIEVDEKYAREDLDIFRTTHSKATPFKLNEQLSRSMALVLFMEKWFIFSIVSSANNCVVLYINTGFFNIKVTMFGFYFDPKFTDNKLSEGIFVNKDSSKQEIVFHTDFKFFDLFS